MVYRILLIVSLTFISSAIGAQVYRTMPQAEHIGSLQVLANADWNSYPIIKTNSDDYIQISFDRLFEESPGRLRYKIILCNADWSKNNELSEVEYLDGFDDNLIERYDNSVNTNILYTHYTFNIPNETVKPKLAGNYAIEIYDEDDEDQHTLLTACFSVVDNQVQISPQVSSITDIDSNNEHHQLSFDIAYQMNLRDVKEDLKVFVRQNNRTDNEKKYIKPSYVMPSKLRYTHNKKLIFEAGNEYDRFDMSSRRHNGKNIAHIEYNRPYYHMYVVPNMIKPYSSYSYDQDQNGRVIYRNTDSDNAETEGDYFYTHFTLRTDEKLAEDIYINGAFTHNSFSDTYRLEYDDANSEYSLSLLLKQGIYNYQLLTAENGHYTTKKVSGNFYETENEYSIYVYYRPPGQRYDSLVGFTYFQSRTK